ncbi:MAG: hypothetical protein NTW21_26090 [Verrucomicrobia bacterium]|nr:hypothetical protein [Verrucomicrobiota bacterium]
MIGGSQSEPDLAVGFMRGRWKLPGKTRRIEAFRLAADAHRHGARIEEGDRADARLSGQQVVPEFHRIATHWRTDSDAGDDDAVAHGSEIGRRMGWH